MNPDMISINAFYHHLPDAKAREAKAATLARKAYQFAKREGMTRFVDPPDVGFGAKAVRCKSPARGVKARALTQYVLYHKKYGEGWMLRVDLFGYRG